MSRLLVNKNCVPIDILLTAKYVENILDVKVQFSDATVLDAPGSVQFTTPVSICRYLARASSAANHDCQLYGANELQRTEVDHWLDFSSLFLGSPAKFSDALQSLNQSLGPVTYLVGHSVTIADIAVWSKLKESSVFGSLLADNKLPQHVARYFSFLSSQPAFVAVIEKLASEGLTTRVANGLHVSPSETSLSSQGSRKERKEEGKFVELPGAEMGKVVVRFPPEASGYLHVGHAKAVLLNQYYQQSFNGKLIMRFDDTNPIKENAEFEKVILDDIAMLGIKPDVYTNTSDHFETLLTLCERMIREGKAYADDTDPETMKKQREERTESKNRNNSVEKNLQMWEEMKRGTPYGQTCCIRAKISMQLDNGCMRDPTMYRVRHEPHVRTGNKYKAYPTYDFACPVVDSLEGVTHALRTTEYHDRDDQYFWFLDALGMRKPYLYEYSRLNLQNTVMSKRKLTWFVDQGIVEGWDDPRFPTVRGVMRRGMTVDGLKEFVIAQGSSRSINMMDWDKIWAFNKKVIDPIVPRFTALLKSDAIVVNVTGAVEEMKPVAKHPKNPDVGTKDVWYGSKVWIERADAEDFTIGENVTFINWGNLIIKQVNRSKDGQITSVDAVTNLDNKDYKKTQKITWLAEVDKAPFTPAICVNFSHLITKPVLGPDEDFKNFINRNSKVELEMLGDPELAKLKKGDIIQLQRRGFYICDSPYEQASRYSGRESPCLLFSIPDGHVKEMPTTGSKHKAKEGSPAAAASQAVSAKEAAQSKKGKAVEKSPQDDINTAEIVKLTGQIEEQGNAVRQLKASGASKDEVTAQVNKLLALKKQYKDLTGKDFAPAPAAAAAAATSSSKKGEQKGSQPAAAAASSAPPSDAATKLSLQIDEQGQKVRQLKASGASKDEVTAQVNQLLALKKQYKDLTGKDYVPAPAAATAAASASPPGDAATKLSSQIDEQGQKVRQLKASGASKDEVTAQVNQLLALKKQYKDLTGKDYVPAPAAATATATTATPSATSKKNEQKGSQPAAATAAAAAAPPSDAATKLSSQIDEQGQKVRQLKASGASKDEVTAQVNILLALKKQFKDLTGKDYTPAPQQPGKDQAEPPKKEKTEQPKQQQAPQGKKADQGKKGSEKKEKPVETTESKDAEAGREVKKVTRPIFARLMYSVCWNDSHRLGLEVKKEENFSEWYSQAITKADMIEYYDVSGCYVLRPWAFGIWERISEWFDTKIKEIGFENCYFPMFVSGSALETEKEHIADFAPEVAWVTKSGQTDLAQPIAIRPTSETVMYPSYAKWVQSHRDLPIKLNQWCSVVRWEFKHPQPFLRTREFLWQEGHSAYATYAEAEKEVYYIIDLYEYIYEKLLAIPVIKGKKTQKEKFAGGDYTTTVEAYIPGSGRGIQAATSHHLGQNFSKMFNISFEDPETRQPQFAYQNSWAITTRSIGIIVMVHGDNKGLVLPPRIAQIQVVLVPCGITAQLSDTEKNTLVSTCDKLVSSLRDVGLRVQADYRDNYSPGWKFNHWELKGVPVRIEIGPRDVERGEFIAVRRDNAVKMTLKLDTAAKSIPELLDNIHDSMFERAHKSLTDHLSTCYSFADFCQALDKSHVILAPFCGAIPCEEKIKQLSARDAVSEEGAPAMGAKGLCIPFKQPAAIKPEDRCICPDCPNAPQMYTLFGRSY